MYNIKTYCLKCKKKTTTLGGKIIKNNNRKLFKGKCKICKTKKSTFVSLKQK